MSLVHDRAAAIAETADRIKAIGLDPFDNPPERIAEAAAALAALAARAELFPPRHYPSKTPGESGFSSFYRLTEDDDYRNAIYVSVCPGRFLNNHPHKHLHWTLIAGVAGVEHNVIFEREDDGSVPLRGRLRRTGAVAIGAGEVHHLRPDEYHTVAYDGTETAINIHAYGLGLDHPEASRRPGFLSPESEIYALGRPGPHRPWGVQSLSTADIAEALNDGRPIARLAIELDDPRSDDFDLIVTDREAARPPAGFAPTSPILLVGEEAATERAAELLARQGHPHLVRAPHDVFRAAFRAAPEGEDHVHRS
ncbi:hypothetical protein [Sphingomonas colocasiae]|uniref:Cysteine dioxygenase n=1 Tax=Sphingomonas colocasiae TaxID=1848973 RepID=A0ABS7PHJ1_9SPHN|nr:hypothetical protein [Sphingomonas colocasiae]MBY8820760.1 hypothetical protein [Sphingomonas colocasiae]